MLANLLTEKSNSASKNIDSVSTEEALRIINEQDQAVAPAVAQAIPQIAQAVDQIVDRVRAGGRLFYIGAGTSGRLGVLDASECPPTYGVSYDLVQGIMAGGEAALSRATEASEDEPSGGAKDLLERGFTGKDSLVGIAASGRTPYVIGALHKARELGGFTASITCVPSSEMSNAVAVAIEVPVGPEVITGSTRMKAGTATKLVLNMISTALMVRLGYVYGNLMVNLQPKNEKLRDRAARIVAEASGLTQDKAQQVLTEAGNVKTAIMMAIAGVSKQEAEGRLAHAQGVLSTALSRNG